MFLQTHVFYVLQTTCEIGVFEITEVSYFK